MPINGQLGGLFKFLYMGGDLGAWTPRPAFVPSYANPEPVGQFVFGGGQPRRNRMYLMKPGFVFNPMTDTWINVSTFDDSPNIKAYLLEAGNGYLGYIEPTIPSGSTGLWSALPPPSSQLMFDTSVRSVMSCTTGSGLRLTANATGSIGPFAGILITTDPNYSITPTPMVMGYIDLSSPSAPSYVQTPGTTFAITNLTFELN